MGRKKKFIDKKNAVSFRLVHRSQRDPLQADEDSSKHVLLPVEDNESYENNDKPSGSQKGTLEERKKEQQQHGVFYNDDYDYLQHLKTRTDTSLQPLPSNITVIEAKKSDTKKFGKVSLPSEVFASACEEEEGLLNLAAPVLGPQPDWDPDIVAALDDALDLNDPDNILEDDFMLKANECSGEDSDDEDERSFEQVAEEEYFPSDGDNYDEDDRDGFMSSDEEDVQSKFSNYSMTSSVIRRTQGLCLLDDRFDMIMEEYEDDEIGALDHQEVSGNRSLNDPLLESIKNEMMEQEKNVSEAISNVAKVRFDIQEEKKPSSKDERFTRIEEIPREQWDCESILSTYSNLYNHPTLIKESSKESQEKHINLSKREGIPLGVLLDGKKNRNSPGGETNQSEDSQRAFASHVRSRGETREEKKARKQLVKQERQVRRVEKKANKMLFKEERKRQEKSQTTLVVGQKIQ